VPPPLSIVDIIRQLAAENAVGDEVVNQHEWQAVAAPAGPGRQRQDTIAGQDGSSLRAERYR